MRRRTASLRVIARLDAYSSTAAAIAGGRRAGTTIAAPSALGGLPIFFACLRLDIPYTNSIDEPDLSYTISGTGRKLELPSGPNRNYVPLRSLAKKGVAL